MAKHTREQSNMHKNKLKKTSSRNRPKAKAPHIEIIVTLYKKYVLFK